MSETPKPVEYTNNPRSPKSPLGELEPFIRELNLRLSKIERDLEQTKPSKPLRWQDWRVGVSIWLLPIGFVEWIAEWIAHWTKRWQFLEVVATWLFVFGLFTYLTTAEDRRNQSIFTAAQALALPGSFSENTFKRKAFLTLTRNGWNLQGFDFEEADFHGMNLAGLDFSTTNLKNAELYEANLSSALFFEATLSGVDFGGADLSHAWLDSADLRNSLLVQANLTDAHLPSADLRDADLSGANLSQAVVTDSNFENADVSGVNFQGVIGLVQAQLDSARIQKGAVILNLPDGLKPPKNVYEVE